jgi:hypothetical protein
VEYGTKCLSRYANEHREILQAFHKKVKCLNSPSGFDKVIPESTQQYLYL